MGLALVTPLAAACDKLGGSKGGEGEATTAAAEQPASPAGDVVRYTGQETALSGTFTVRSSTKARKAADKAADVVETLAAGTRVTLVAQYAGGTFSLVQWSNGTGWLETSALTQTTTQFLPDAGTRDASTNFPGLNPGATATVPGGATTPTSTTPTPPPTTTTPTPPPTTTTPKPPTTSTSTGGAKPPPPPPKGTSGGPKPPKL